MGYSRSSLSNGVRVVTEEIPHVRSASLGLWVAVGSRHEEPSEQGISHFIEHMLFKGTPTRTARQIAEEFDSVGGQVNAYTSREYTCYYAKVLDEHLDLAMEILSDMFLNSSFSPIELEREKGVVLEEIKSYEDSPEDIVHDLSAVAAYGEQHLGQSILGSVQTVQSFDASSLRRYMEKWYVPGQIVVSAAGNVNHERVTRAIESWLGRVGPGAIGPTAVASMVSPRLLVHQKDVEQTHLVITGSGVPRNHDDKMAILILDTILGGGMSSRLFQELREERGLVYSAYTCHTSFNDTGIFSIYAGMSPENLEEVAQVIKDEIDKVFADGISDEEVARAKEHQKGSMVLGLESTSNRQSRLAKMELFYDRLYTPDEVLAKIDAVTTEQVIAAVRNCLAVEKLSAAVVGPQDVSKVESALGFIKPAMKA